MKGQEQKETEGLTNCSLKSLNFPISQVQITLGTHSDSLSSALKLKLHLLHGKVTSGH